MFTLLTKYAEFQVIEAKRAGRRKMRPSGAMLGKRRTAHKATFNYTPKRGYIYVRSRAISSRCNDNFDEFPAEEIKQAYGTFVGKPVFVNHHNDDHRRARGVIIDAVLHEDANPDGSPDTWVEVLMEVDAVKFPKLAEAILKGHIDRTSMGTDVAFSKCSVCGNEASTPLDYCKHIPAMKGQTIWRTTASGEKKPILVRELCYGLRFFENSLLVEDPADPTAFFLDVDDRGVGGGYQGGLKTNAVKQGGPPPGWGNNSPVPDSRPVDPPLNVVRDRDPSTAPGGSFDVGYSDAMNRRPRREIANEDYYDGYAYGEQIRDFGRGFAARAQRPISETARGSRELAPYEPYEGRNYNTRREQTMSRAASRRHAYGETIAPREVNTLRDESCPVCGEESTGDKECPTCGYTQPPEEFTDPDLAKHKEVDLKDGYIPEADEQVDPNDVGGDEVTDAELGDQTPAFDDADEESAAQPTPGEEAPGVPAENDGGDEEVAPEEDLQATVEEDQALLSEVTEVLDEVKRILGPEEASPRVEDQVREVLDEVEEMLGGGAPDAGLDGDEVAEDAEAEEGDEPEGDGEEDGDDDLPDFITSDDDDEDEDDEDDDEDEKGRPVQGRRTPREGVTASSSAQEERHIMGPALKALRETTALLRTVSANQTKLQRQLDIISRAAGLEKHTASLRITADEENPAQPVPAPESKPAEDSTSETRGDPEPSGELQDAGGTSETETSADEGQGGDAGLLEPGAALDNESLAVPEDVTQPVDGTTEPRPTDEVRTEIEPEHRGLDTEVAYPESQPLFGEEPKKVGEGSKQAAQDTQSEGRLVLAMRLARARIAANIGDSDDDLAIATKLAQSETTDAEMRRELSTLEQVSAASKREAPAGHQPGNRRLVPRQAARSVPSLSGATAGGNGGNPSPEVPLGVSDDEFLWD